MVKMLPVKSSNIAALGYDPVAKELHVKFLSGATHAYADVPATTYTAFLNSPSLGSHFSKHIREEFKSRKVDAP